MTFASSLPSHLRQGCPLAHELDGAGVAKAMEVHPPPDSGSAGQALHHVAAVARI